MSDETRNIEVAFDVLRREREGLTSKLAASKREVSRLKSQLQSQYNRKNTAEVEAAALRAKLEASERALSGALTEVGRLNETAPEQVKQLKAVVMSWRAWHRELAEAICHEIVNATPPAPGMLEIRCHCGQPLPCRVCESRHDATPTADHDKLEGGGND